MTKKKKGEIKIKVRVETEKSYRWGLCMKFAKHLYRSTMSAHLIEQNLEQLEQEQFNKCN